MITNTTSPAIEPPDSATGNLWARGWTFPTLLAFRFVCTYFVLQWIPWFVSDRTLTAGILGDPYSYWRASTSAVGQWVIPNLLRLPEHSPPRLSGNSLPLFAGMVTAAVVSAVVAIAWSTFDRRRVSYPRLFVWIHTFMRFTLASAMLTFGWAKVLPVQFAVSLDYLALPVGQHNPRDLLWAFMGGSRWYQVFAGLLEVAGGVLLLTRRTAMLGAFISMAAMANVLVLDIAYDVPVKFQAGQMFLMALFVLAPFGNRLVDAFFNRSSPAAPIRPLLQHASGDWAARVVGVLFGVWIVYAWLHVTLNNGNATLTNRQTPLYGVWDVEELSRNGVQVPLLITDGTLWRRLVVQSTSAALLIPMSDSAPAQASRYGAQLDSAAKTVRFSPYRLSGNTEVMTFAYALPDPDHLVLTSRGAAAIVMRLRRFDPSTYTLVGSERHWAW